MRWADPVCWDEVVPAITAFIDKKNSQFINGFKSSCRQEPHETLKPVAELRFAGKSALAGPGSQLCLLL